MRVQYQRRPLGLLDSLRADVAKYSSRAAAQSKLQEDVLDALIGRLEDVKQRLVNGSLSYAL